MNPPFIPLVDLNAQYASIAAEVEAALLKAARSAHYILGPEVAEFEKAFAEYCGARYAVGVGSGTDAIHLACRAGGLKEGDEVLMPAMTFVATALGISLCGAKPVLVDVDPEDALISVSALEAALTPRTRAVLPVHLYGQMADMEALEAFAKKHELIIIEDAAQAHGARRGKFRAGGAGLAGCFSFYPGKNLGAWGDGGLITTSDTALYEKLLLLRNWGSVRKYHHEVMGLNSRLDTLQAAVLSVKLRRLDGWNEKRRLLAQRYREALSPVPGIRHTRTCGGSIHHLFVVRVPERDAAVKRLNDAGIGAGIHYPFAVSELPAYQWLGYKKGDFPKAEEWARTCLSLPLYPEMPEEAVARAASVLRSHCAPAGGRSA